MVAFDGVGLIDAELVYSQVSLSLPPDAPQELIQILTDYESHAVHSNIEGWFWWAPHIR